LSKEDPGRKGSVQRYLYIEAGRAKKTRYRMSEGWQGKEIRKEERRGKG